MDNNEHLLHIMSRLRASLYDFIDISGMDDDKKASFKRLVRSSTDICWESLKQLLLEV